MIMIRLSGAQRELMEILWETGPMTLHDLTKCALGNLVSPARTETVRYLLLQMVTKKAVTEDAAVSPHIYTPAVSRDEVGFESAFTDVGKNEGSAILTALSSGVGVAGMMFSENNAHQIDEKKGNKGEVTDEARKEAIKEMMAKICKERDEYEAKKAQKKASGEDAADEEES
jgi:predicted transcriptional regulator